MKHPFTKLYVAKLVNSEFWVKFTMPEFTMLNGSNCLSVIAPFFFVEIVHAALSCDYIASLARMRFAKSLAYS